MVLTDFEITSKPDKTFIRITENSKVFKTSAFAVDQAVVDNFMHAPMVSIAEALGSPAKRRLSIEGKVVNVSPKKQSQGWTRTDVLVADAQQRICCKLWNVEFDVNHGDVCALTNLVLDEFNDQKSLNSSDESEYTVSVQNNEIIQTAIVGFDINGDTADLVMANASVCKNDQLLLENNIGDVATVNLPLSVTVRVNAGKITAMEIEFQPAEAANAQ